MSTIKEKLKASVINLALLVLTISVGLTIGTYAPQAKQFYNDIGQSEINIAVSQKHGSKVVLFGRDSCPFCTKGKALLKKNGIEYVYLDVENDKEATTEFNDLKEDGVPVLIVGDIRLRGFSEDEWKNTLMSTN